MERSPQRVPRADVGGKPTGGALLAGLARTAQRTIDNDVPAAAGVDASSSIKTAAAYEWQLDAETARLTTEAFRGLSDYLHRLTNEPSIGLHHCTNHIGCEVALSACDKDSHAVVHTDAPSPAWLKCSPRCGALARTWMPPSTTARTPRALCAPCTS